MSLITILVILGAWEFYHMALHSGRHPLIIPGVVLTALFIIIPYVLSNSRIDLILYISAAGLVIPLLWLVIRYRSRDILINWVWTIGAIFYLGWTLRHYVTLLDYPSGKEWVLIAMLPTFACDTSAYFVGKSWGKHKLAPLVSPNKTWEGAAGGFSAAIGASLLCTLIFQKFASGFPLSYGHAAILGCLIGILAQLGDLLGSRIKRITGVKDSGNLLPGHGGIIDRIGSLVFTALLIYYYVFWFVH